MSFKISISVWNKFLCNLIAGINNYLQIFSNFFNIILSILNFVLIKASTKNINNIFISIPIITLIKDFNYKKDCF